jgi:hypothetical protein
MMLYFNQNNLGFIEAIATALVVSICQYFLHQISGDDRLIYPLGTFRCWYSEEIQYAMELGYTFKFKCAWVYPEKHLFSRLYQ